MGRASTVPSFFSTRRFLLLKNILVDIEDEIIFNKEFLLPVFVHQN